MILKGKTAVVTGAAHRVGSFLARSLAEHGCDLVLHYHEARGQAWATASALTAIGVRVVPVQADLRTDEGIGAIFRAVDENFGSLDILVQSAAILDAVDLLQATPASWAWTMDLNLRSAFFCLQQSALRMRPPGGGAIVNISDIAGLRPWPRYPIHSISKAGLEMLTRVAARRLAPTIRVNAIAPGPVLKPTRLSEERWAHITGSLPLQRGGSPEDVARALLFLLQNDYVTGETVVIDGGDQLPGR